VETAAAARAWIAAWKAAWVAGDPDPLDVVYAEGARFRSEPFRDLQQPRAYAEWAFAAQDSAECWFGEPIVDGDRAAVEYWGVVRFEGADETIVGTAVLRFGPDGKVVEQRDTWNSKPGRFEPPHGWGR
jgi:hypothetical protein